jgi:hypothetical protein
MSTPPTQPPNGPPQSPPTNPVQGGPWKQEPEAVGEPEE